MAGYILGGALNNANQNTNPFGYKTTVDFTPKTTAPAPAGGTAAAVGGGGVTAATATRPGGAYTPSGGGGGGGSYSFDFSNNSQGPTMAPMPQTDWSGLFSGMSSLMDKGQQGDIPENVPLSTQKDTMQLQGLRESAAGWRDLAGPGGMNPALGQRILPDESKKLAALQTARIY